MSAPAPRALVLGLGNPILRDDAGGLLVARAVRDRCRAMPEVEVREACVAGFDLLDILSGFERAVIVDAIETGGEPGTVHRLEASRLPTTGRLAASHEIGLAEALALGRLLSLPMPATTTIVAIEVADARSFGECPTPAVVASVATAADEVMSAVGSRSVP